MQSNITCFLFYFLVFWSVSLVTSVVWTFAHHLKSIATPINNKIILECPLNVRKMFMVTINSLKLVGDGLIIILFSPK